MLAGRCQAYLMRLFRFLGQDEQSGWENTPEMGIWI